jgi:S1-C subfamily serine protease
MKGTSYNMIRKAGFFLLLAIVALCVNLALPPGQEVQAAGNLAPETFADLAKKISPAVVNISTEKTVKRPQVTRRMPGMPPGPSPFGPEDPFPGIL